MSEVSTAGRPTSYSEEMQTKADEYILSYEEVGHVIPSVAGLCGYLGVSRSTCYLWGQKHPRFSDTLEAINVVQETKALNAGLTGQFNSTITKLVLANHGYNDSAKVDHTSSDGSMSPADSSAAVLEALKAKHSK